MDRPPTALAAGMQAFIAAGVLTPGDDPASQNVNELALPMSKQRRAYDRMCASLAEPRPRGVTFQDQLIDLGDRKINTRAYTWGTDTRSCVVWYHGGGFTLGGLDSHDSFLAKLCAATHSTVISIDYRLAPEHVYPAATNDCYEATRLIASGGYTLGQGLPYAPTRLVVGGDSAGGNLAAAVCLRAREVNEYRIHGQVLVYPGLSSDMSLPSYEEHAHAPNLARDDCTAYLRLYAGDRRLPHDDPLFAPLAARDLTGLPPAFVISAGVDPLRDDAREWARRLIDCGCEASYVEGHGLVHGFIRAAKFSNAAAVRINQIFDAVSRLASAAEADERD